MCLSLTLCSIYTHTSTSPTPSSAYNSVTFPLGPSVRRGHFTDIKKNQSLSLGLTVERNGSARPQWAYGSFCHAGSMPRCHNTCCASSQLGRTEGRINEEEEEKEIAFQGGQTDSVQLITRWPPQTKRRGNWSPGCGRGSRLRMSQKRYEPWRKHSDSKTGDTRFQWETISYSTISDHQVVYDHQRRLGPASDSCNMDLNYK